MNSQSRHWIQRCEITGFGLHQLSRFHQEFFMKTVVIKSRHVQNSCGSLTIPSRHNFLTKSCGSSAVGFQWVYGHWQPAGFVPTPKWQNLWNGVTKNELAGWSAMRLWVKNFWTTDLQCSRPRLPTRSRRPRRGSCRLSSGRRRAAAAPARSSARCPWSPGAGSAVCPSGCTAPTRTASCRATCVMDKCTLSQRKGCGTLVYRFDDLRCIGGRRGGT